MKKYKYLFLLIFALVFCALFCVSASAATDDGTGIFVGGVLVTDANSHDILGDGSAKYDPNTYTLTIKNYDAEGVVRTDDSGEASDVALSVYVGVGKTAITVIVEGDCFFSGGVVNMAGKVEVKNASITFGPSAPTFLYARNGALDIVNSKITMEGVNFLSPIFSSTEMGMGFFASQIGVKDSSFTLKPKNCEAYNLNRLDALFCSADNSSFQNCDFRISTPFPVFRTLFQAYTNALVFTDCDFDLSGQMYCFLASGNTGGMENVSGENLGAVLLSNCEIEVEIPIISQVGKNCKFTTLKSKPIYIAAVSLCPLPAKRISIFSKTAASNFPLCPWKIWKNTFGVLIGTSCPKVKKRTITALLLSSWHPEKTN